ncbi:leucine-rich repeat domain-containing protein [Novipirellula herctigrandis]
MPNQLCILMLVVSILYPEQLTALLKSLQATTERGKDGAIVRIALSQSDVTDDDLSIIASAEQLRKLDLYGTNISDAGLIHVSKLRNLESLNLGFCNRLTNRSMDSIVKLRRLKYLNLGFCRRISDDAFQQLAALTELETLNLSLTSASDNSLKHIAMLKKLDALDLDGTTTTNEGLKPLIAFPKLRSLRLVGTPISDDAIEHLAKLSTLRHLYVKDTRLTQRGLMKLEQEMPDCRIIR